MSAVDVQKIKEKVAQHSEQIEQVRAEVRKILRAHAGRLAKLDADVVREERQAQALVKRIVKEPIQRAGLPARASGEDVRIACA